MAFDEKLKAEFAAPEGGWTRVTLRAGDSFHQFFPSYTPYDSFTELLKALLKILDGDPEAVVRWNDEPTEHKFLFTSEGGQITFKVYEIINSVVAGKVDEEKFDFSGSQAEVMRAFWKGLRDMQSRQNAKEFEKQRVLENLCKRAVVETAVGQSILKKNGELIHRTAPVLNRHCPLL